MSDTEPTSCNYPYDFSPEYLANQLTEIEINLTRCHDIIQKKEYINHYINNHPEIKIYLFGTDYIGEGSELIIKEDSYRYYVTDAGFSKIEDEIIKAGNNFSFLKIRYKHYSGYSSHVNLISEEDPVLKFLRSIISLIEGSDFFGLNHDDRLKKSDVKKYKYNTKELPPLLRNIDWQKSIKEFKEIVDRFRGTFLEYNDFNKVLNQTENIFFINPNAADNVKRIFQILTKEKYILDDTSENDKIINNFRYINKPKEKEEPVYLTAEELKLKFDGEILDKAKNRVTSGYGVESKNKQFYERMFPKKKSSEQKTS